MQKLNPSVEAPIGRLLEHIKERLTADKNDKETSSTVYLNYNLFNP